LSVVFLRFEAGMMADFHTKLVRFAFIEVNSAP